MSAPACIDLASAEVVYEEDPDSVVVHDVDWSIAPGEWWIVWGGSGSGKTSLFSTAAGLTPPADGTVQIFGRDYWHAAESEQIGVRRRIGFVFDGGGRLFAHMTVLENLILPIQYHDDCDAPTARARALELLEQVRLSHYADAAPSRLSQSLQRRVALARALTDPLEVLFLDSPIGGLGPGDARWWLDFLRELMERAHARGARMSIVASGYDVRRWLGWATRFAELRDGRFRSLDEAEARSLASAEDGAFVRPGSS